MRQRFLGPGGGLSKHRKVGRPLQVSLSSIVLHDTPAKGACCPYLSIPSKEELTASELVPALDRFNGGSSLSLNRSWILSVTKS